MYVVVAYDAEPDEQKELRRLLSQRLNRVQNSVFAGELRRLETETLARDIREIVETARVQIWVYPAKPEVHLIGVQRDQEDFFV